MRLYLNNLFFATVFTAVFSLASIHIVSGSPTYKRVCYFYGSLPVEKVNFTVCSHILYYGMLFNDSDWTFHFPTRKDGENINGLKLARQIHHNFKLMTTLVSCGQIGHIICGSIKNMTKFAKAALSYLLVNKLDGFDFDWEWPGSEFKEKFGKLLQIMRKVFDEDSDKVPLLISAAVSGFSLRIFNSYDLPSLAKSLDFIDIMGYDYRAWSEGYLVTGHHAPLYPTKFDFSILKTMNLNWSANYYSSQGIAKERIVLGLPAYAHGWELLTPSIHGLFAPAISEASPGSLNWPDVCSFLEGNDTVRVWDHYAQSSYAYNGRRWYSFNDLEAVRKKAEYVKNSGFGGTMVWSLDIDADFGRHCSTEYDFPIHSLLTDLLQ